MVTTCYRCLAQTRALEDDTRGEFSPCLNCLDELPFTEVADVVEAWFEEERKEPGSPWIHEDAIPMLVARVVKWASKREASHG
jgi:hypothetical protein